MPVRSLATMLRISTRSLTRRPPHRPPDPDRLQLCKALWQSSSSSTIQTMLSLQMGAPPAVPVFTISTFLPPPTITPSTLNTLVRLQRPLLPVLRARL